MRKSPTLREIAEQADVALSTVSQALNNRPGVSAETRQHVLQVAESLGYKARIIVESNLDAELKTIGLVTKRRNNDEPVINPFYSYVIAGAEHECAKNDISLMYANVEVDENSHATSLPAMLADERVDGVIVLGAFLEETIAHIRNRAGNNIVLVDAYTSHRNAFDSVLIDNIDGAQVATQYLIDKGHKHIAIVGSNDNAYPSIRERFYGYKRALSAQDLQPYVVESVLSKDAGYEAASLIAEKYPQVTAVFACNDDVAIGVMKGFKDIGLRVPDDMSIIGFDDITWAQEVSPALTTIRVDKVMMGKMAVRHLIERSLDADRTPLKTLVSVELIERQSVKNIE